MIGILTFSSNRYDKINYYLGADIISQYLIDHGFKSRVMNFTVHLYQPDSGDNFVRKVVTYNDYEHMVPDLHQLPAIMQVIKNYKDGKDLLYELNQYFTDLEFETLIELIDFANNYTLNDGDIIGQQVLYLFLFHNILFTLQLKKNNPDKKFTSVFGGYHITLSSVTRDFLSRFDFVDYLVINDGRKPMLDIARGEALTKELIGDYSETIKLPDYTMLERRIKSKALQVLASVGCPNNCRFCASNREHAMLDLDYIKDYVIKQYKRYPFKYLIFTDDTINPTKKRIIDLCKMLIEVWDAIGREINWSGHFYTTNVDDEVVDMLHKANCYTLFLGTETFDDDILKLINKGSTVEEYTRAIKALTYNGIITKLGIIAHLPGETDRKFLDSLSIIKELQHENLRVIPTVFKLYAGSHIYENPELYNIEVFNWDKDIVDQLPETKNMIIPKRWDYTVEMGMSSEDKISMILDQVTIDPTYLAEVEHYNGRL
jgi:hypothetical protein